MNGAGEPAAGALVGRAGEIDDVDLAASQPKSVSTLVQLDGATLDYRPLKAPREDRAVLIEPPLETAASLLAEQARREPERYDVQGRALADLAAEARSQFVAEAWRYTSSYRDVPEPPAAGPVLLAGHQPQMFHPGVWLKNFALGYLAGRHGGTAVNLLIDGDTIKNAAIRVPVGSPAEPFSRLVPYDDPTTEIPYEERGIQNASTFESFGRRAAEVIAPLVADPLVERFWPMVVGRSRETGNLGECLAQARHQLEGGWGLSTLEMPLSRVCTLGAFAWFAAHWLAQLPRLHAIYNDSVALYRRVHRIRSLNHPVPGLAADGDWLEAPFWIWTSRRPHRRRVFARARGRETLLTDREGFELALPLTSDGDGAAAAACLAELPGRGIRLRTRALATTLFARMFLGDLFLHGIGGGKYDQLTDLIVRRFFGIRPPPWIVLSATLHLPIPRPPACEHDVRGAAQRLRGLTYHPERHVALDQLRPSEVSTVERLIATKRRWIETEPAPANARRRCREIRAVNEALQAWVEPLRRHWLAEHDRLVQSGRALATLSWREYAFCLHREKTLRDFLLDFPPGGT
ncbi:MAG: hypothetical protein WD278_19995 [Pirellulales bacterium]